MKTEEFLITKVLTGILNALYTLQGKLGFYPLNITAIFN